MKEISLILPIFGSHVQRIGWARTTIGGFSMYLCIPPLITSHLILSLIFYRCFASLLFNTKHLKWKDFIVIDRHRIEALSAFDKLNCMFCGYANGVCTLINHELDQIAQVEAKTSWIKRFAFCFMMIVLIPWTILLEISYQLIYNVLVSRPLGMHQVSIAEAIHILKQNKYAAHHTAICQLMIRISKNFELRFAMALEQIESSWCPLKHFECREGITYPDHHTNFFDPCEVEEMRLTLTTKGTVSPRNRFVNNDN